MPKVLLVEDDQNLADTLSENLRLEGLEVAVEAQGNLALEKARAGVFDLIILDVMIPELSGLEVLTQLRTTHNTPVLMISAKGSSSDRIRGLELQADDYLPKPFHLKEFLLRVQNLLRRAQGSAGPTQPEAPKAHNIGRARFDLGAHTVFCNGQEELLTAKEVLMLSALLKRQGQVVSREQLVSEAWGVDQSPSTRTIDNFIVKLRRWVEVDPAHPQIIISHRGVGYSLHIEKGELS